MIYLDSSFLVSLYAGDANTSAATNALTLHAEDTFVITNLTELETVNAFGLWVFRKEATAEAADASLVDFDKDIRGGIFVLETIPEAAFEQARRLSRRTTARMGTRTADLLHVAAALELAATGFFSFDLRQRSLASDAGLTLNPLP